MRKITLKVEQEFELYKVAHYTDRHQITERCRSTISRLTQLLQVYNNEFEMMTPEGTLDASDVLNDLKRVCSTFPITREEKKAQLITAMEVCFVMENYTV